MKKMLLIVIFTGHQQLIITNNIDNIMVKLNNL